MDFLRIGSICELIRRYYSKRIVTYFFIDQGTEKEIRLSQVSILTLVQGSVYSIENIEDRIGADVTKRSYASDVFKGKRELQEYEVVQAAESCLDSKNKAQYMEARNYIDKYIYEHISNEVAFFTELKKLVLGIPYSEGKKYLLFLSEQQSFDNQENNELKKDFLTHCILYSLTQKNKIEAYRNFRLEEFDVENDDPHGLDISGDSKALSIFLVGKCFLEPPYSRKYGNIELFHTEMVEDYIQRENLLIKDIRIEDNRVKIYVEKCPYCLRMVSEDKFHEVIGFFEKYQKEFKSKASWHGMNIAELVEQGLKQRKWIAWCYFDGDKPVAYLDMKQRTDLCMELGAELVDKEYRKEGLGQALIYFFRIKHPMAYFTSGTYEENQKMRKLFEKLGFIPNIDTITGSNIKKDRINSMYPWGDKSHYTNSVYYKADPLYTTYMNKKDI